MGFSAFEIDELRRYWALGVDGRFPLSGDRRFLSAATEYLWASEPLAEYGKRRYAKIRIVPSPVCALFDRPPFPLLIVWRAGWLSMSATARSALIDWLACQIEIAKGGARLARPDIVEHSRHLADYGAWLEWERDVYTNVSNASIQPSLFDEASAEIDYAALLPVPKSMLAASSNG